MRRIMLLALLLGAALSARASDPARDASVDRRDVTVTAYWENDSVFFKPNHSTDRWYTNGVGFSVQWHPRFAADLAAYLPFAEQFGEPDRVPFGVTVGQLMFTPDDINNPNLIRDERPYAGYLYGAAILQRVRGDTMDHFQLEIGQTGDASLAEDAQKAVHDLFDDEEPRGWDNQIQDELQVQAYLRKRWRLDVLAMLGEAPTEAAWGVELIPEVGAAVGTVAIRAEGGAILRAGWRLPDDFGPSRLQNIAAPAVKQDGWSIYGFIRATGQWVAEDRFVEGSYSRGGHGLDHEPLVGEFEFGTNLAYTRADWAVRLGYSQTYRTPTFKDQPVWHGFGAWTLSVQHWF